MARRRRQRKPAGQTGRPSKMADPRVRDTLLKALGVGLPIDVACRAAGIDDATYYRWIKGEYPADIDRDDAEAFCEALTRASDEGIVNITAELAQDMRGRMFILERRRPELFGKIDRHEVSGPDGGPIVNASVDLGTLPDSVVAKLHEAVEAMEGDEDGS